MTHSTNQSLLAETDSSLIRAELERLLSHRRFSGARQMSAFLRYVVSETLDGNSNRIKAYTVGVDALGKDDDFDAQSDPSVRVLALRLRKTLEAAYADKPQCHAIIVMTVGSYVPQFYKTHAFASNGDSEKLQQPGGAAMTGNAQVTSGKSDGSPLDNDLPGELHSASRRLSARNDAASQPRFAEINRTGPESGEVYAARKSLMPDSLTDMLRERLGVVMAVALLAAAWQVSVKTASAATIPVGGIALQAESSTVSQIDPRTGNFTANALNRPEFALPSRL